ncbi:MAG TPA: Gfo/Idh/MocA family oxidoreductase [Chloroflexota bacterium]|nr:Gfo/Idh/MocA family oxidoreductase [Chloroflexota bacterium]
MTRQWRVGVLGLGHWYSAYGLARALAEHPRASLVAVASPDAEKRHAFASTFHLDEHETPDDLLVRTDVDIVHICPPVRDIPEYTIKAAAAGKHMVVGKPLAMTLEEADAMVDAIRRSGVTCMPFQGTYRVGWAGVKRRLTDSAIGDVVVMHATSRWSIAEDWFHSGKPGWFADPTQVPGGAFIDEGVYAIDQLCWLAESSVVEVSARVANLVHDDIGVEDWGFANLTFSNGIVATIEASWTINSPRKSGPSPKQNGVVRVEIVGTRGEMIQDSLHGTGWSILGSGAAGWVAERVAGEFNAPPSAGPMGHLIDCLDGGTAAVASIEDARAALAVGFAAYESARMGKPIRL